MVKEYIKCTYDPRDLTFHYFIKGEEVTKEKFYEIIDDIWLTDTEEARALKIKIKNFEI